MIHKKTLNRRSAKRMSVLTIHKNLQEVTIERDRLKQEVTKLTEQLQSVTTESSTLRTQIEKLNKDNKDLKVGKIYSLPYIPLC